METAFPNITIKFIVSFLFLSTYVLGIVLNALHTLLSSIHIIFKDSLFYRWRLDDLKARTFKSGNFAHFQGSSRIIHSIGKDQLIMILLFSNWANRHVIRIKKYIYTEAPNSEKCSLYSSANHILILKVPIKKKSQTKWSWIGEKYSNGGVPLAFRVHLTAAHTSHSMNQASQRKQISLPFLKNVSI